MPRTRSAFTFTEMLVGMAVFSIVSVALFIFTSTALRLVGRNMATNHSHEVMRTTDQELLYNLHASATAFHLVSWSGVMLADTMMPNGVSIGRPPANGFPLGRWVWHARQSDAVVR